jgi:hypothetical protein
MDTFGSNGVGSTGSHRPDHASVEDAMSSLPASAGMQSPAAFAMSYLAPRIADGELATRLMTDVRQRCRTTINNYKLQRRIERELGVRLPISGAQVPCMMNEVRRFQWLEAERAGRDIWAERDKKNPERVALSEWFRKHFGAWYLHHQGACANGTCAIAH